MPLRHDGLLHSKGPLYPIPPGDALLASKPRRVANNILFVPGSASEVVEDARGMGTLIGRSSHIKSIQYLPAVTL